MGRPEICARTLFALRMVEIHPRGQPSQHPRTDGGSAYCARIGRERIFR